MPQKMTFMCLACNKFFSRSAYYEEHLRSHTGEKPFECETCNKAFSTARSRNRHKITLHSGKRLSDSKAKNCDRTHKKIKTIKTYNSTNDNNHKLLQLKCLQKMTFMCLACDKFFARSVNYEEHLRSHTGEKPFECEICNKAFSTARSRNRHRITLHSDKRLSNSKTKVRDRTHIKTKTIKTYYSTEDNNYKLLQLKCLPKMSYMCLACDKFFSRSAHYEEHLRSHTGEKPFECEICNKAFSIASNLKRHKITVHSGKMPSNSKIKVCDRTHKKTKTIKTYNSTKDNNNKLLQLK